MPAGARTGRIKGSTEHEKRKKKQSFSSPLRGEMWQRLPGRAGDPSPLEVAGATATLVGKRLYLIGGRHG